MRQYIMSINDVNVRRCILMLKSLKGGLGTARESNILGGKRGCSYLNGIRNMLNTRLMFSHFG